MWKVPPQVVGIVLSILRWNFDKIYSENSMQKLVNSFFLTDYADKYFGLGGIDSPVSFKIIMKIMSDAWFKPNKTKLLASSPDSLAISKVLWDHS